MDSKQTLEERISEWRTYLRKRQAVQAADVEELEDHLRSQVEALGEAGLSEDEAFLVAVKRMGDLDSISREFAREYSQRLWKQLVVVPEAGEDSAAMKREATVAVGLAVATACAIKIPGLFGMELDSEWGSPASSFYNLNLSLLVLPFLAVYFAWKRKLGQGEVLWLAAPFIFAALIVNLFPFKMGGHTEVLAGLHLPIALWMAVGFAYVGGRWRDHDLRMNFVRFSGEWVIYYTLIALGGCVLMFFTVFVFDAIGLNVSGIMEYWLLPCGSLAAIIIGAWLVEAKQSVIENMAPVLTRLFTPLFAILLIVFLATMLWTGSVITVDREVLIGFDLLLALVLGLLIYSISARDHQAPPDMFDKLQLLLIVSALLVDVFALSAIMARITGHGLTPNKVAALGENLILLTNLGWSAVLYVKFLVGRETFSALERWQTAYLPVYAIWAWIVVVLFPVIFTFI